MTNKLPVVGKRYRWKHAPDRYHLVVGFFRDKIVAIDDKYLGGDDEECLDCAELMTPRGFWCNCEEIPEDKYETKPVEKVSGWDNASCPAAHHPDTYEDHGKPEFECPFCGDSGKPVETKPETLADELYQLEKAIIVGESQLNTKKALLRIKQREFDRQNETKPETQSPELSPEVKEAMEELRNKLETVQQYDSEGGYRRRLDVLSFWTQSLLNALDKQFNQPSESAKEETNEKEESIWKPVSELNFDYYDARKVICFEESGKRYFPLSDYLNYLINDYEKLKERVRKLEETKLTK